MTRQIKSRQEIDAVNEQLRKRFALRAQLLRDAPIVDRDGTLLETGQLVWLLSSTGEHGELLRVCEVQPSFTTLARGDMTIVRQPLHDWIELSYFRVRTPEQAERDAQSPSNVVPIPVDWFIGYHETITFRKPHELRVVSDKPTIDAYRHERAAAQLRGIEYQIELLETRKLQARRRLHELDDPIGQVGIDEAVQRG